MHTEGSCRERRLQSAGAGRGWWCGGSRCAVVVKGGTMGEAQQARLLPGEDRN